MSASSASNTKPQSSGPWGKFLPPALFLVCVIFSATGLWRNWDRSLSDALIKIRCVKNPMQQDRRIMAVDLNDSAERNLGDLVDNRSAFRDLLMVLGEGQLRGGMDFLFQKSKDPEIDRDMGEYAAQAGSLVLAIVPVPAELSKFSGKENTPAEKEMIRSRIWHPANSWPAKIPYAETFILPVIGKDVAAVRFGHIAVLPDDDGLYRKVPLFYRWEDGYMPSFGLSLAVEELRIDTSRIEIHAGSHLLLPLPNGKEIRIPIDDFGNAWVPYTGLWKKGNERTPLDAVVTMAATKGGVDELINQWSDGIVIAADLTTGAKDFGSTPVEPVFPLSGIHTALLNGILTGTFYSPTPFWIGMIIALILLAAVFLANRYLQGTALHLGFGILLLLLFIFVCVLWFQALILPWFFAPAMGLLAAWIAAFGLRVLKAHEERLLLESALSRYFSRALAMRVLTEKKIDLIPVSKEVTVLFADIAGFTRWSSDKTPELVHRFLCFYLESMASIIFDHGGTIDKFMGDGILAFFGDPLDQPDHAERALRTALDMQKKAHEIREMWFPRASMDLKIRIGVNTGQAIVGNLGSETRIEYTVIGAAVNFGQRMESNAPVGGTLVSHTTYEIAKTRFGFGEQRQVTVKGYDQPVTAYVLESEIAASKTDEIKK